MFLEDLRPVEEKIREIVSSAKGNEVIYSAISYAVENGGKRIRPSLTIAVSQELKHIIGDFDYNDVLDAAACVELMHTASLILDDVVDNSDTRRGKPSLNAVLGNKIAVISASYLLGAISQKLSEIGEIELIEDFSITAKTMAEGEMLEFRIMIENIPEFIGREEIERTYFDVINKKTASLFSLSSAIPAILGGTEFLNEIKKFGTLIGMAFQIKDDILDFVSDITGKPRLKDVSEGKITIPIILSENFEKIISIMRDKKANREEIPRDEVLDILKLVVEGGGIQNAEQELSRLKDEIFRMLDLFGLNPKTDQNRGIKLRGIAEFITQREF